MKINRKFSKPKKFGINRIWYKVEVDHISHKSNNFQVRL